MNINSNLPPQDDYTKMMNDDLVNTVNSERLSWRRVNSRLIDLVGMQSWKQYKNAYLVIPDKSLVKSWTAINVGNISSIDEIKKKTKINCSLNFNFFGYNLNTKDISEITGLAITTVYKYWQRSEHDIEIFESMIAEKMSPEKVKEYMNSTNAVRADEREIGESYYDC